MKQVQTHQPVLDVYSILVIIFCRFVFFFFSLKWRWKILRGSIFIFEEEDRLVDHRLFRQRRTAKSIYIMNFTHAR